MSISRKYMSSTQSQRSRFTQQANFDSTQRIYKRLPQYSNILRLKICTKWVKNGDRNCSKMSYLTELKNHFQIKHQKRKIERAYSYLRMNKSFWGSSAIGSKGFCNSYFSRSQFRSRTNFVLCYSDETL